MFLPFSITGGGSSVVGGEGGLTVGAGWGGADGLPTGATGWSGWGGFSTSISELA